MSLKSLDFPKKKKNLASGGYVVVKGVKLRWVFRGDKQKGKKIYQSASASPSFGLWYSSAKEAAQKSNASDRIGTGAGI